MPVACNNCLVRVWFHTYIVFEHRIVRVGRHYPIVTDMMVQRRSRSSSIDRTIQQDWLISNKVFRFNSFSTRGVFVNGRRRRTFQQVVIIPFPSVDRAVSIVIGKAGNKIVDGCIDAELALSFLILLVLSDAGNNDGAMVNVGHEHNQDKDKVKGKKERNFGSVDGPLSHGKKDHEYGGSECGDISHEGSSAGHSSGDDDDECGNDAVDDHGGPGERPEGQLVSIGIVANGTDGSRDIGRSISQREQGHSRKARWKSEFVGEHFERWGEEIFRRGSQKAKEEDHPENDKGRRQCDENVGGNEGAKEEGASPDSLAVAVLGELALVLNGDIVERVAALLRVVRG